MSLGETIRNSQIWKSVFRHPMPVDRRNRIVVMLTNFFLHLHPGVDQEAGDRPELHLVHGGSDVLPVSGRDRHRRAADVLLPPDVGMGLSDMQALRAIDSLGIMRELHRWGAHAMVITVWLHMYRVFLTGSYKPPREFNWVVGVILLLLTLLLSFTGYLLPWDQLAIWAITVGSNMARATPFLGHEGPGHQLLNFGGIPMITNGSDARYALLARAVRRRGDVESVLRVALRGDSAGGGAVDGDPLLAGAERRRH